MQPRGVFQKFTAYRDWTPWFVGVAIIILGVSVGRQVIRRYTIEQELRQLEQDRLNLAGKNTELTELLDYVRSPNYTEEQARLRLGLAKPGERLAVIADQPKSGDTPNNNGGATATNTNDVENYVRWWSFFFSP